MRNVNPKKKKKKERERDRLRQRHRETETDRQRLGVLRPVNQYGYNNHGASLRLFLEFLLL